MCHLFWEPSLIIDNEHYVCCHNRNFFFSSSLNIISDMSSQFMSIWLHSKLKSWFSQSLSKLYAIEGRQEEQWRLRTDKAITSRAITAWKDSWEFEKRRMSRSSQPACYLPSMCLYRTHLSPKLELAKARWLCHHSDLSRRRQELSSLREF